MSKASWPWYSFLYRVFGPQGTFVLWCLAAGAIYLNADTALVTLINDRPQARSIADVASQQFLWQTWVTLEGVELSDARQLMGRPGQTGTPLPLLIDPSDPAAEKWKAIAEMVRELGEPPDRTTDKGRAFTRLCASFNQQRGAYLPRRPIILISEREDSKKVAPVTSQASIHKPPVEASEDFKEQEERTFQSRVELIRSSVKLDARHEGMLDTTPPSIVDRAFDELELDVAPRLLRIDRRPRMLPLYIVGGAAFVLLFLIAGLIGVSRAERASRAAETPPDPPPSEPEGS